MDVETPSRIPGKLPRRYNAIASTTRVARACLAWRALRRVLDENFTPAVDRDRKSTRLNSSHLGISYAVFCLKKKIKKVDNNIFNLKYGSLLVLLIIQTVH